MGRARPRAAVAFAVALGGAALAQSSEPPLKAMRWLAAEADPARVLTQPPGECLVLPEDDGETGVVYIGRAAFRTPVLLGGQAARAGLSCESCHQNGRGNPHFHFPGVSGAAGTADVTSSLFSTHRGNGVDDPKPIPDLGGPKAKLKVSQAPGDPALGRFIRGLVVEEFDGPEPTPSVLQGLVAYVRALDPGQCAAERPLRAGDLATNARRGTALAKARLDAGDAPTALFLIAAARAELGRLDERYPGKPLAGLRGRIRAMDGRLAAAARDVRLGETAAGRELTSIFFDLPVLARDLEAAEPRSLFNPDRLKAAAKPRLRAEAS